MNDNSFTPLLNEIQNGQGRSLLIADENLPDAPFPSLAKCELSLLTNRFDIFQQAQTAKLDVHFNDFDTRIFESGSFQRICYRVSKEKPVVHHLINRAFDLLANDGELILSGEKNDGLKTYAKKAASYFGNNAYIDKNGNSYTARVQKEEARKETNECSEPLDDKNYPELRQNIQAGDTALYSKPGVFGWDKIDRGSAFLVEHLPKFLKHMPKQAALLDLGCGYGYLASAARDYGFEHIVATDNNAAALAACKKNFDVLNIPGEVIADDAGSNIRERFNIVLCNPPFHQGFTTDGRLTDKFLATTKRVLRRSGKGLFVVNSFVPLPQKAKAVFDRVDIIAENSSFKLVVVS